MHAPLNFIYQGAPARVVFGRGSLSTLAEELDRLGVRQALVLTTPGQRAVGEQVAAPLGDRAVGVFDRAVMHVPIEVAREAVAHARSVGADGLVAVGGGSTIGLGKAIALEHTLPIVAVPTTFAGSEMTPIYGITEGGLKKTGRDARVLPRTVLYDATLVRTLPAAVCVTSGFNAIAHAAEALYAHDGNPIVSMFAEEGLRAMAQAIRGLRPGSEGDGDAAREQGQYGAWLCGTVLGAAAMGLHHKLCHTLGGSFNLPHAETHTVMLPHTLAYNAAHAPEAMSRAARALGLSDAGSVAVPAALFKLMQESGAPLSLQSLGMPAEGLDRVAELAVLSPYPNPRPLERTALREMLQRAHDGVPPVP
jgi:maleylacetate reductase